METIRNFTVSENQDQAFHYAQQCSHNERLGPSFLQIETLQIRQYFPILRAVKSSASEHCCFYSNIGELQRFNILKGVGK